MKLDENRCTLFEKHRVGDSLKHSPSITKRMSFKLELDILRVSQLQKLLCPCRRSNRLPLVGLTRSNSGEILAKPLLDVFSQMLKTYRPPGGLHAGKRATPFAT